MTLISPPPPLLLGRPEFAGDLREAAAFVRDRRVLLTGAGGSIGSPMAHVLLAGQPASLVLLDHHEHSLFSLERALGAARAGLTYELADIRDPARLERIFAQQRPDTVIHLAAAKHVPYGERFPEGAVAANVLATETLLHLADQHGVGTFVYPSSDKSVQPPSVYGATKRLAEALVQTAARDRCWAVVRYVNIIGTRGSVIETFTQQVQADRPLSVTDERMARYWISMDEALWSALSTARCAAPGDVLMPACGEPVPIIETARRLAGWYRPEQVPYPIKRTGIRPGERLHEVLLSANESFAAPPAPGLRTVRTTRDPGRLADLPRTIDGLRHLAESGDRIRLARACLSAAEALQ
ncbi:MAG: polysaccharide biosynthesis protein [Chloroflexi bacterium]|nr:polysaccharide biosynthesis protein [Chloroflexota bacterium]